MLFRSLLLHTAISLANSDLSSFNSMTLSLQESLGTFSLSFHVSSLRLFIGDQRFTLFVLILSVTRVSKSFFPISPRSQISFFTFSGIITLVTKLINSLPSSLNGSVKFRRVVSNWSNHLGLVNRYHASII